MSLKPDALRRLLAPQSLAIVGASPTQAWTRHMVPSLRTLGYRGEIFLVNPQYPEIDGMPCYPSIPTLPLVPDAVIVVVRRDLAIKTVEDCATAGVGGVAVLTGGFADAGPEGRELEEKLVEPARRAGMALIGPNCQGFINTLAPAALWMDEIYEPMKPGGVAVIAHSGSVSTGITNHLIRRGTQTNYTISLGNEAGVTVAELIAAFAEDDGVRVIAAYLETIREPQAFFAACDKAAAADKPVVVLKAGRSPASAAAIAAHTGALAGPDRMVDALLRRHKVTRVQSLGELVETCIAFSGRRLQGPRIGAFCPSGGQIELMIDAAASTGLQFPDFSDVTVEKLCALMPPYRAKVAHNPFDTGGIVLADAAGAMATDPGLDGLMLMLQTNRHPTGVVKPMETMIAAAERLHAAGTKPVVVLSANDDVAPAVAERLAAQGIALVGGIETGLNALENVARYAKPVPGPGPVLALDKTVLGLIAALTEPLAGQEALDLLAGIGLTTVRSIEAATVEAAVMAAKKIGFPVVVKTGAKDVLHKSDSGQVFLNLSTEDDVCRAAGAVKAPILVQTCVTGGIELILGLQSDPGLGTCIAVGLGGVLTELMDKVVLRPVPLRQGEAAEMLAELPLARLLEGYRGSAPVDRASLIDAIERVAALGAATGLQSLDLNPVIATAKGAIAVDALLVPLSS